MKTKHVFGDIISGLLMAALVFSVTVGIAPVAAHAAYSLSITTPPAKTSYAAGECFDPAGLVITDGSGNRVTYSETTKSTFNFNPDLTTPLKTTDKSVTIYYGDSAAVSQAITVSAIKRTIMGIIIISKGMFIDSDPGQIAGQNALPVYKVIGPSGRASSVSIPAAVYVNGETVQVTAVANGAFKDDPNLKNLMTYSGIVQGTQTNVAAATRYTRYPGVKVIGSGAFRNCKNLKTVKCLNSGLTVIKSKAFCNCRKLKTFTVKSKVLKTIGPKAFYGCKNLKTITLNTTKLTKKGVKNALKGSSVKTVRVRKSMLKKYKKIFTKKNCGKKVKVKAA